MLQNALAHLASKNETKPSNAVDFVRQLGRNKAWSPRDVEAVHDTSIAKVIKNVINNNVLITPIPAAQTIQVARNIAKKQVANEGTNSKTLVTLTIFCV